MEKTTLARWSWLPVAATAVLTVVVYRWAYNTDAGMVIEDVARLFLGIIVALPYAVLFLLQASCAVWLHGFGDWRVRTALVVTMTVTALVALFVSLSFLHDTPNDDLNRPVLVLAVLLPLVPMWVALWREQTPGGEPDRPPERSNVPL